ncbi:hypothetical protein [Arthrobacter methylotrophus]|uniref:Secreted protein n=1 Tax=Arthrobacter methylotrophus TaxID=121291 RepID=A0ABV5UTZ0_9MICC
MSRATLMMEVMVRIFSSVSSAVLSLKTAPGSSGDRGELVLLLDLLHGQHFAVELDLVVPDLDVSSGANFFGLGMW